MSKQTNGMRRVAYGVVMALMMATAAFAQDSAAAGRPGRDLVSSIVSTVVFGSIGIALAIIGFKLFDVVVKHNIENEIFDNKNMAAALLAGSIVLGVCMIIAATILSP
jgi:hypothetical protein